MNETEISIDKIKVLENTRTELGDLSELMSSIRENGLLQPIGIWQEGDEYFVSYGHRRFAAMKKLGRTTLLVGKEVMLLDKPLTKEEFLIKNITENIQRVDNSPLELGKVCLQLRELGLTDSEIASRLAMPRVRITTAMRLIKTVPDKFKSHIGYIDRSKPKMGKISATAAEAITHSRLPTRNVTELFDVAHNEELSLRELRVIFELIRNGMSTKQALEERENYVQTSVDIVFNKRLFEEYGMPASKLVNDILRGIIRLNPKLVR